MGALMEAVTMTYRELMQFLQSLPDAAVRLDDNVTVYDAGTDEFYGQVELLEAVDSDVLDDNHFYLAWEA
ncbi:MAG: hypothetical protein CMH30_00845 [Micavibrio sp.]|nr:hypothetical protein [Micavibrio sp.]|tara:strand:+ start:9438 stop:9647 length:210 start_codon:yes stop_codon:yes gene_type:complete